MAANITDKFTQATNGSRPAATTLTALHSGGDTTMSCSALTGWPTATAVHFIVYTTDASGSKVAGSQTDWKGVVSGTSLINCELKAGTDSGYSIGAIVECAPTAYWAKDMADGMTAEHEQDGTHGAITPTSVVSSGPITGTVGTFDSVVVNGTATTQGWTPLGDVPDTVTANGNRNYDLVFNGVDHTSTLSPGMKLQLSRTVAAPDQCTDLEASSSQYFSRTGASVNGMTFTDDFTVSAWVKLESYADTAIASRYNGTSGWIFKSNTSGQISLTGLNGGAANQSSVTSHQSIPLNKWVHVAAQLDMSAFTATTTTSYVMIDGVDVAASVARGGTNPTALVQAGDLQVGAQSGAAFFDGKIAQVAIYSAKVTQATIKASMDRGLSGSETSLISAYSFDNSINDLNANANNLTAQGSAVATATDSPFANAVTAGLLEYAEINSVTFSTNTTVNVRVPDTCQIPTSGGVSAVSYSTQSNPYGLPYFSNLLSKKILNSQGSFNSTPAIINGSSTTIKVKDNSRLRVTLYIPSCSSSAQAGLNASIYQAATVTGSSISSNNLFMTTLSTTNNITTIAYVDVAAGGDISFCGSYSASSGTGSIAGSGASPITLTVEELV